MQPEKIIEDQILQWLSYKQILSFKVKSQGTYDEKIGGFRRRSKFYRRGVADILGIYKGRFLAIEVKTEKGRASIHQKLFLQDVINAGGIALIARSVEDLERKLGEIDADKINSIESK